MGDWIQAKDETVREDHNAVIRRLMGKNERLKAQVDRFADGVLYEQKENERMRSTMSLYEDALEAVLIFHSGKPWHEHAVRWLEITGDGNATTAVLCDHIRKVLNGSQIP